MNKKTKTKINGMYDVFENDIHCSNKPVVGNRGEMAGLIV